MLVDGGVVKYTPWDESEGRHAELTKQEGCGENRFVGIENYLEFYLTVGCEVHINPRDAILTAVRMDWSLDDFYGSGGVTSFANRVAASLGIHASTIKIVAVYEGSVVVEFAIQADESVEDPVEALEETASTLNK